MRAFEHRLLTRDPHPQSLAALVLLTRKYLVEIRPAFSYRTWLIYRRRVLSEIRKERGSLSCHYCGKQDLKISTRYMSRIATLDHVIPRSKGGDQYSRDNLVVSCFRCNQKKKDSMPP